MTINEVYEYGSETWSKSMRLLELSNNTYQRWLKLGYIPMHTQLRIEKKTKKRLIADVNKKDN